MGHFLKKKHFVQSSNIPKEECFDFDSSDETDEMDDFFSLLLSRFGIFVAFLVGALATAVGPFCESGKTFLTLSTSEATLFPAGIGASSFMKMGGSPSMAVMKVLGSSVTKSMFNLTSVLPDSASPPTGGTLEWIRLLSLVQLNGVCKAFSCTYYSRKEANGSNNGLAMVVCYLAIMPTYKSNDSRSNPSNILKGILFENSKIEHVETSVGLVGKKFITYNDTI